MRTGCSPAIPSLLRGGDNVTGVAERFQVILMVVTPVPVAGSLPRHDVVDFGGGRLSTP
jgi:hypothetical protein